MYETNISIPGDTDIEIPLERNNMVEFILYDGQFNSVTRQLEIEADELLKTISTPHTMTLKSGFYDITGEIEDDSYLGWKVEIPSVDTTILLTYVADIDNYVYKTIQIGAQWWMAENLRTTRYADGTLISGVYNYEDEDSNAHNYGRLYTWDAVMNGTGSSNSNPSGVQGVCPEGWHVPSNAEWQQLEMYFGMTEDEVDEIGWREHYIAGKLKSTRTEPDPHPSWKEPNIEATNESGFSALPGGYRSTEEDFFLIWKFGYWWSSTESFKDIRAWYRGLDYNFAGLLRYNTGKQSGLSVRCVKD